MFCPNCGTENAAATGLCSNCGQSIGPIVAVPAAPLAAAKPAGTRRTLGLMPLWFILTVNIYWMYWLYQTYKEIRAHTPGATDITPGKAVGFMFIPFFNLYWFFRVMADMPRAIRRLQEDDPLGEPLLNNGLVTGLLIAGIAGNLLLGQIHPGLMLLSEPLLIAGFLLAQSSLNAHWERHAAGAVPQPRLAQPAAAVAVPRELGTLLGVRSPEIEWGAGAAFLIASALADLVYLLIVPLLQHGGAVVPLYGWLTSFSADLFLTGAAMAAFRWVRNDAGAAALAAVAYTIPQTIVRVAVLHAFVPGYEWQPVFILNTLIANFLFLLLLALAVRGIRPVQLGLWLGATGGQLAAFVIYRIASVLEMRARMDSSVPFHIDPWDVVTDLAFAAVLAFAFWGLLALMAPRVLQDS